MPNYRETEAESAPLDAFPESVREWWRSVLTGQTAAPHPIFGADLNAKIDGETLIVSGTVTSEDHHRELLSETARLKAAGIDEVRDEVEVVPDSAGKPGLLTQTLVGTFENAELARVALDYLKAEVEVRKQELCLIDPRADEARSLLRAHLPQDYWKDAEKAIDDGHALLIVSVDETEAFKAREVLDEDTRTLETLVLPPEPAPVSNTTAEAPKKA
jgi:hypothetical protein